MIFKPGILPHVKPKPHLRLAAAPTNYYPPKHIDRRAELLPSSNQKQSSECVAYSLAGVAEYYRWKRHGNTEQIDPAPIYKRAKEIDGFPNEDGTSLEAGLKAAQELGHLPPVSNIREIYSEFEVKQALHRFGVVFGAFTATDLWSTPSADGWMKAGGNPVGGHAVLICGMSEVETPNYYSLQNSWGEDIGWHGFVRMSPEQFRAEFSYGLVWDV